MRPLSRVSMAGLALAHGVNANQLRNWVALCRRRQTTERELTVMSNSEPPAFVPGVAVSATARPLVPSTRPTSPRVRLKAWLPNGARPELEDADADIGEDRSVGALRCSGWLMICASNFTGIRSTFVRGSTDFDLGGAVIGPQPVQARGVRLLQSSQNPDEIRPPGALPPCDLHPRATHHFVIGTGRSVAPPHGSGRSNLAPISLNEPASLLR
ncbi:hypothetical protein LPJGGPFB_05175 [Ensifer adhaerens]|nr:hypothetical protein [Ensifer adhaerens]